MEIRFGDVVIIDLADPVGSVQGNKRYATVIQNDMGNRYSPTTLVIPFTTKIKKLNMPNHTVIKANGKNGLKQDSMALGEQVMVVNKNCIKGKVGRLGENDINKVVGAYMANLPSYALRAGIA